MSINLENLGINKLYLGSSEIKRAFLGSELVYGSAAPFKFSVTTTSENNIFVLPLVSDSTINSNVVWGDGEEDTITAYDDVAVSHTFTDAGTYTITMDGVVNGWEFKTSGLTDSKSYMTDIINWGVFDMSHETAFFGCTNMIISATDVPTITTDSFFAMFNCAATQIENIGLWDVSTVTTMANAFYQSYSISSLDLTGWDVSNVTSLSSTFGISPTGTIDISGWDMSNVSNVGGILTSGQTINAQNTTWGASNSLFSSISDSDVLRFDFTGANFDSCTSYSYCFGSSTLTSFPDGWYFSDVATNMVGMFNSSDFASLDLSDWNVSNVGSFRSIFSNSDISYLDITGWDMASATNVGNMFGGTYGLTDSSKLIAPDLKLGATAYQMFYSTGFLSLDLSGWDVTACSDFRFMFEENLSISTIDISSWQITEPNTTMRQWFYNASNNNPIQTITTTDTNFSGVTDMQWVFYKCKSLQSVDALNWTLGSVTNVTQMFIDCDNFSDDLSNFDVTSITSGFNSFMSQSSGLDTSDYDATLIGWASQVPLSWNSSIDMGGSVYTLGGTAEAARNTLIADGVTFTDGGGV